MTWAIVCAAAWLTVLPVYSQQAVARLPNTTAPNMVRPTAAGQYVGYADTPLGYWTAPAAPTTSGELIADQPPAPSDLIGANDASYSAAEPATAVWRHSTRTQQPWCWQVLPEGLIYRSYLAGVKEPRFAAQWVHEAHDGWIWDIALGGRAGLLRYGTADPRNPEGWQVDIEGAGLPRLDLETDSNDLVAVDFRLGVPLTYGRGPHKAKLAYYHISSHLGDEFMLDYPAYPRINYVRDAVVLGHSYYWTEDVRLYGEAAWAFNADDGAEPWEFQFGAEYSPAAPTGSHPAPFYAVNGHLREEIDFGGNLTVQVGYQWRGVTGQRFRVGLHYFTGKSDQYEFYNRFEDKIGLGVWYDY